MKYAEIEGLEGEKFRRLTGVKRTTFEKMLEILRESAKKKQAKGGRMSNQNKNHFKITNNVVTKFLKPLQYKAYLNF